MKIQTIYAVPYRHNLAVTLRFGEDCSKFWTAYPKRLDDALVEILDGAVSLSVVAHTLYARLHPLGLFSVTVIDVPTGSGMEISHEDSAWPTLDELKAKIEEPKAKVKKVK